jgi:exodeoxyribonuclease-3
MKIMTYNILHGGIDSDGSRIEHIIDTIKKEKPDFVAIQEAHNFDKNENELLKRVSNETKLPYYALSHGALEDDLKRAHVVSLSRYPLQEEYLFPDSTFKHAALSVVIDSPLGKLSICNIHLHAHSGDERVRAGDERVREAEVVLSYQSKYSNHIILGDFNSLSRLDNHGDLSAHEFTWYDLARFEATDIFNMSHIDAVVHINVDDRSTHPTIGVTHRISKTPIRIDYVFLTPSLSTHIKNAKIIKTPTAEKASDHYPVVVTLG